MGGRHCFQWIMDEENVLQPVLLDGLRSVIVQVMGMGKQVNMHAGCSLQWPAGSAAADDKDNVLQPQAVLLNGLRSAIVHVMHGWMRKWACRLLWAAGTATAADTDDVM